MNKMTKHQTLVYLKYGKLISEINDKITDSVIKSDMIKFLVKFPGNLIYPNMIYQMYSENQGRFQFEITKPPNIINFIFIDFDGNNNFRLYSSDNINFDIKCTNPEWASINNIEHYVDTHLDYFNKIIE